MAVTDDERRRVAEKLRASIPEDGVMRRGDKGWSLLYRTIFGHYMYHQPAGRTYSEVAGRLADLIEPSEPKVKCVAEVKVDGERLEELAHDAAAELTDIDRDALLALADELEEDACWEVKTSGDTSGAWRLKDACDLIREILGVES